MPLLCRAFKGKRVQFTACWSNLYFFLFCFNASLGGIAVCISSSFCSRWNDKSGLLEAFLQTIPRSKMSAFSPLGVPLPSFAIPRPLRHSTRDLFRLIAERTPCPRPSWMFLLCGLWLTLVCSRLRYVVGTSVLVRPSQISPASTSFIYLFIFGERRWKTLKGV